MMLLAEAHDDRVDLNRVDVLGAVTERRGDVGSRTGSENQHIVEAVAEHGVGPLIEVFLLIDVGHRLVKNVIHLDDGVVAILGHIDFVVRGPQAVATHAMNDDQRCGQQQERDNRLDRRALRWSIASAWNQVERQCGAKRDAEPRDRWQLQPRHQREGRDTGQAAEQVDRVGLQWRPRRQLAAHLLGDRYE